MINYILLALLVWFTSYVLFVRYRYGILESISDSYYKLQETNKGWVFTLFCWGLGALLLLLAPVMGRFMVVAAMGAIFTGSASNTSTNMSRYVHLASSGLLIVGALLSIIVEIGFYLPTFVVIMAALTLYTSKSKNLIWWLEIVAFITVIASLTLCLNLL